MSDVEKPIRQLWSMFSKNFTDVALDGVTRTTAQSLDEACERTEHDLKAAGLSLVPSQCVEVSLRTDWENAPRDRSPVLLKFKQGSDAQRNWPDYIVARHNGLPENSSIDFNGWGMPGYGGWIDEDFEGFLPLPTPPEEA